MKIAAIGPREVLWRRALEEGDASPQRRIWATLRLGRQLVARGELAAGSGLLREAARTEDPELAPRAAWALAEALLTAGDADGACEQFSHVAAISSARSSPDIVLALASRYAALGLADAAADLYRRFLEEASPREHELTAVAAYRLADLYLEEGRSLDQAIFLLRRAIRHGSGSLKTHAMSDLADLLSAWWNGGEESEEGVPAALPRHGDGLREAAETLYRRVLEADHADLSPRAAYFLAELHEATGDSIAAEERLRAIVLSEHPFYMPLAKRRLAEIEDLDARGAVDAFLDRLLGERQMTLGEGGWRADALAAETRAHAEMKAYLITGALPTLTGPQPHCCHCAGVAVLAINSVGTVKIPTAIDLHLAQR